MCIYVCAYLCQTRFLSQQLVEIYVVYILIAKKVSIFDHWTVNEGWVLKSPFHAHDKEKNTLIML